MNVYLAINFFVLADRGLSHWFIHRLLGQEKGDINVANYYRTGVKILIIILQCAIVHA